MTDRWKMVDPQVLRQLWEMLNLVVGDPALPTFVEPE